MAPATVLMTLMNLEIGGAETHAVILARHLTELGYRIIMASSGGVLEANIATYGIKHYKLPLDNSRPKSLLRAIAALRSILVAENVALVHAHARIPAFASDMARRLAGIHLVTTAHAMFTAGFPLKSLSRWGERTIAVSADIKEHMIKSFNLEASKVILIPNGIDIDTFAPGLPAANVAHELRGGSDKTLIVYASRLDAPLAPVAVNLIEACGRLYGEYPGLRLVVAGDGKHAVEVAARARVVNANAGAELVRLLGARTDMNRIMASADLIVGVSRVALEAMASGKNVILAGGEGYGGLVSEGSLPLFTNDNFTGRQFSKEASVQNIEDSIREFLYLPTESRKYMELLLRQFIVENYSSMRMARETAKVYEGVCSL